MMIKKKRKTVFLLVRTMCAKLYVYSSVNALNINSAYKKYEENSGFGCISINLERKKNAKRVVLVWQICNPKMLMGADRSFCCSLQKKV